jgi:micrococcal nuclease
VRRDSTLAAYVLLTLLLMWSVADRFAPHYGTAADCRLGYVYDGDTVEIICGAEKRTARLVGFDTPETKEPDCAAERALGEKATLRLRALVKSGQVRLYLQGHDKYGRDLARLTVAGRDVGDILVGEGLAHAYHGGQRGGWCDGPG